jgi:hypothetical protein
MARGYLVFGDIEGKLDILRVECTRCPRKGRYSVPKLIEKYRRKANMMKWREHLGPLLSMHEAANRYSQGNESVLRRFAEADELLILPGIGSAEWIPEFQFAHGRPIHGLAAVISLLKDVVATPYTIAAWLKTPQPQLNGQTAADWLAQGEDLEIAREAARRVAAQLAH